jgi:hypothetical protein
MCFSVEAWYKRRARVPLRGAQHAPARIRRRRQSSAQCAYWWELLYQSARCQLSGSWPFATGLDRPGAHRSAPEAAPNGKSMSSAACPRSAAIMTGRLHTLSSQAPPANRVAAPAQNRAHGVPPCRMDPRPVAPRPSVAEPGRSLANQSLRRTARARVSRNQARAEPRHREPRLSPPLAMRPPATSCSLRLSQQGRLKHLGRGRSFAQHLNQL